MKKFIVTAPIYEKYHTLFEVTNSSLKPIRYEFEEDLFQDEHPTEKFRFQLPLEITEKILQHLMLLYLKSGNFEKLLQLISISPHQIRRFFRQFFGPLDTVDVIRLHIRISEMFKLATEIVESLVCFPNEEHDHYFALEILHTKRFHPYYSYHPWNFRGKVSLFQIPKPGILHVEDFRAFVTGPNITDIVWMTGYGRNGVVATNYYRQPVVVLSFCDKEGHVVPEKDTIQNSATFKGFATMLRIAFGPTSGIFFSVKEEYIFGDNLLVEL